MTESSDEKRQKRAERARQNGSKGRGATSTAGAARSKLNGLDGGLRAQTYPLPGEEDADAAAQAEWDARYRPTSPAAVYHAKQCARGSVIADRCERFARARIADQKRKAVRNFQRRGPRRVKSIMARIPKDRLGSVSDLAGFSDGCRKLASILAGSIEFVSSRGYLLPEEIDTAIWAHGIGPVLESLPRDVTAYTLYILNLGCTPGVTPAERDARLDPARRPPALRGVAREALLPADPQVCGEQLRALIQKKCDEYQAEADRLRKECDEPELRRMLQEAEFLSDADAKRWQRCHAEQRLTFLRSEQALYKALDRDREAGDDRNGDPGSAGGSEDQQAGAGAAPCPTHAGPEPEQAEADGDDQNACLRGANADNSAPRAEPAAAPGAGHPGSPVPGDEGVGLCTDPHPATPLPPGEGFSPSEPRNAPEAPPQMMSQREHPAEEQGAGQGVPLGAPGGAGHDHDAAPPAAPPPPPPWAGPGGGLDRRGRPRPARGGWVPR
jgi:hypothetical protein